MSMEDNSCARETTVMDTLGQPAEKTQALSIEIDRLHGALGISAPPPMCGGPEEDVLGDLANELHGILHREIRVLEFLQDQTKSCLSVVLRLKRREESKK